MRQIKITIDSLVRETELLETPTAEAIWNALPYSSTSYACAIFGTSFIGS